jgi:predicted Zn-dependent peptidase|tara:strand:+ start:772 stop:2067 length:1296 start_codon:yes stop_codon:yes gene_type:complete
MSMTTTTDKPQVFQKTTMPNGLRVLTCEMPHTRSVSISIFVGVGSRYETDEEAGVSHFIEHLVFKGTESKPDPVQISGLIEGGGGVLNASTEQELTVYWCKIAESHFSESLELLIDMLRNSLFEADSIEKERMVVLEELAMIHDQPSARVDTMIDEMLWPGHPLGRDIGGTNESVSSITRDAMLRHLNAYYAPDNIVISIAGSISTEAVLEQVETLCGDWPRAKGNDWSPFTHEQSESQLRLEYRRTEQLHLSIALPGLDLHNPARYALDLLSVMLGEGMSSRLFVEVREKRGLAYDVHSGVSHFQDTGAFAIIAGVDSKRVYEATSTILEQVAEMWKPVPQAELDRARQLVAGRIMLRMEDTRAVSGWMGSQEALMGRVLTVDEVVHNVRQVTGEEVARVADDLLSTEKLNLALVGPCRGRKRLERLLHL